MGIETYTNSEFLGKIIQEADVGRSFVPLIGSGMSSPSGIIMGMEFTNYLAFTMYLVLSDPSKRKKTYGENKPNYWDLRHQGWPPLPSADEVIVTKNWIHDNFCDICSRYGLTPNYEANSKNIQSLSPTKDHLFPHDSLSNLLYPQVPAILGSKKLTRLDAQTKRFADWMIQRANSERTITSDAIVRILANTSCSYQQRLIEVGIRALHDWRETLVFLASIAINFEHEQPLSYDQQNDSVIDRFNATITRDKQPNLGHKMIAHLAGPMRINSILTTNFDSLLENAFRTLNLSIRVLPVSSKGELPEPQTVGSEMTLVKLHGEIQNTRADTTLDDEPADKDKMHFSRYLTRGAGNLNQLRKYDESKRLLVMGYSGSDHRCIQMIKHWLEKGADNPTIYWVCFSSGDVDNVRKLFGAKEYNNRIRVTQTSRPDLLLYELYQRLVLAIPPGGLTYEFSHTVPPRRDPPYNHPLEKVERTLECISTMNPLEAACVMLGGNASIEETRRLARDAAALDFKRTVIKAIELSSYDEFYNNEDNYTPIHTRLSQIDLWRPTYRNIDNHGKPTYISTSRNEDEELFKGIIRRPLVLDTGGGAVRGVSLAVDEITARSPKRVLWFETMDYMDADSLLMDLLRTIALRYGCYQGRHVSSHPFSTSIMESEDNDNSETPDNLLLGRTVKLAKHIRDALIDYRAEANDIIIIIYGRDSYGGCSGMLPSPWTKDDAFRALHLVIEAFARAGITVLYLPSYGKRSITKIERLKHSSKGCNTEWLDYRNSNEQWQQWPEDTLFSSRMKESELKERAPVVFDDMLMDVLRPYYTFSYNEAVQKDNSIDDEGFNRLKFLYALTLFRHSRHINSLCSEAVYQCPSRFNSSSIDNDFLRSEEIERMLDDLRRKRIFFDKPGGSLWMHRDTRLTLQILLENLDLPRLYRNDFKTKTVSSFREMRARIHFWIGDWYQKAYCSSGHLMPVVESLHHRVMSAVYAPYARFGKEFEKNDKDTTISNENDKDLEVMNYRANIFESALLEAQKTLLLAWQSIKYWHPSPLDTPWLSGEHRKRVCISLILACEKILNPTTGYDINHKDNPRMLLQKYLDSQEPTIQNKPQTIYDKWKYRMYRSILLFINGMESMNGDLLLEGAGKNGRIVTPLHTPLSAALDRHGLSTLVPLPGDLKVDHGWEHISMNSDDEYLEVFSNLYSSKDVDTRVDINNNNGVFPTIVYVAKQEITNPSTQKYSDRKIESIGRLSKVKAEWIAQNAGNVKILHNMIWLLGETAYSMLRRAKMHYHAEDGVAHSTSWIISTICCNLGIDLCKHLPPSMLNYDISMKIRLNVLYGTSLANLGRFFEANRHFNEAQAFLSKSANQLAVDYAIINLRRAESLLTECLWIGHFISSIKDDTNKKQEIQVSAAFSPVFKLIPSQNIYQVNANTKTLLGPDTAIYLLNAYNQTINWCAADIKKLLDESLRKGGEKQRPSFVPPRIVECIRKNLVESDNFEDNLEAILESLLRLYSSVLDEAIACLEHAETDLSGNSQSSLWWSRLYTLKLRVYGLLKPLENKASESLILRKLSADQGIYESFRNACRIARDDKFRLYRAVKYFFEANEWHCNDENERNTDLGSGRAKLSTRLPESYALAKSTLQDLQKWSENEGNIAKYSLLVKAINHLVDRTKKK